MDETTHTRAVELLPWLVNGTLESQDRRQLEEHLLSCTDCRHQVAATREAFALYAEHLPPAAILGYAEAPEARSYGVDGGCLEHRVVEAHLEHCESCRDELELTRESLARMEGGDDAGVGSLSTVTPFDRPVREAPAYAQARPWLPMALAASLLLAVVSGGGWFATAQRADQGEQRIVELQERLETVQAERPAGAEAPAVDPVPTDSTTPDSTAADPAADEARRRLAAELEETRSLYADARNRVAGLETELDGVRGGVPAGGVTYVPFEGGDVLRSGGAADSADDAPVRVRLDERTGGLILAPTVDDAVLAEAESLRYRVTAAGGRRVVDGVLPVVDENSPLGRSRYVTLFLPASYVPSGTYTLTLRHRGEVVGEYDFRVER